MIDLFGISRTVHDLVGPTHFDRFYLEYLGPFMIRWTGEIQSLVGPVSADFTIRSITSRKK